MTFAHKGRSLRPVLSSINFDKKRNFTFLSLKSFLNFLES